MFARKQTLGVLLLCLKLFDHARANQFALSTTMTGVISKEQSNSRQKRWPLQATHTRKPEKIVGRQAAKPTKDTGVVSRPSTESMRKKLDVGAKCFAASISCIATWFLIQQARLPAARASSICGLVACALFPPPLAAACLSGAFTGMSSYMKEWSETLLLAAITGVVYGVESSRTKFLVGKGGRLGTISVLASILYFAVRQDGRCISLVTDLVDRICGARSGMFLGALILLYVSQTRFIMRIQSRNKKPLILSLDNIAASASKMTIISILASQFFGSQFDLDKAFKLLQSTLIMFCCSLLVYFSPGNVLPMSIVGFIASFSHQVAPMCIGGLTGMTKLPGFSLTSLLECSLISSMLLGIGGLDGIGGRLGIFTIFGVSIAMNAWFADRKPDPSWTLSLEVDFDSWS